jgi:hypothetical protein
MMRGVMSKLFWSCSNCKADSIYGVSVLTSLSPFDNFEESISMLIEVTTKLLSGVFLGIAFIARHFRCSSAGRSTQHSTNIV